MREKGGSSLNFRYSSLITLKYHIRLAPSLTCHHSIFFTLFVSPIPVIRCIFFLSTQKGKKRKKEKKETQITETSEKRKEKGRTPETKPKKKKR